MGRYGAGKEIRRRNPNPGSSQRAAQVPHQEFRQPCGTGVSAKLACPYADCDLKEGEVWCQAGILGGVFEGKVSMVNGELIPQITGEAFVTAETEIVFSPGDPYRHGIGSTPPTP